jgi:hypothetical protein
VLVGRALVAALSGSVSVAAVGAVIGIAVVTSSPTAVASTTTRTHTATPAPQASVVTVNTLDQHFAQGVAKSLSAGVTALQNFAIAPKPTRQPTVFNTAAMDAGLADSSYTFTASITGLADMSTLGSTVTGTVIDPTHFTLEFPQSTTITKYQRDGDKAAFAWVAGHQMLVAPGSGSAFGTISAEDFLPARLWAMAVDQWSSALKPDTTPGDYLAPSATLTATATHGGYAAKDWTLKAHIDESGRLTSVGFAGTSFDAPFELAMTITYA